MSAWFKAMQDQWQVDTPATSDYIEQLKIRQGTLATFVGGQLTGLDGGSPAWQAAALGDSVLFHVRGGRLITHLPELGSGDFDSTPEGISTRPESLGRMSDQLQFQRGRLVPGDMIFVATDAFAKWMITSVERDDQTLWPMLGSMGHPSVFTRLVNAERQRRAKALTEGRRRHAHAHPAASPPRLEAGGVPMNPYPLAGDYQAVLQNPGAVFTVASLRQAQFAHDGSGLPAAIAGTSAAVFQVTIGGDAYALRCYTREDASSPERYAAFDNFVASQGLSEHVGQVTWHDEAVRVKGATWPVLQMEWIEGQQLNEYVGYLVESANTDALATLASRWLKLVSELQRVRFAHGDLQHGNVIIDQRGTAAAGRLRQHLDPAAAGPPTADRDRSRELSAPGSFGASEVGSVHGHLLRTRHLHGPDGAGQRPWAVATAQQR